MAHIRVGGQSLDVGSDVLGLENIRRVLHLPGGEQSVEHLHQLIALPVGHAGKPVLDGGIQELGGFRHLLYRQEMGAFYLPGVGIVLHDTHAFAANDNKRLLMLQQHPNHRGLGDVGLNPGHDGIVARVADHVLGKAGAVVVVDRQNPLAYHGRASGGGKHRQIAALGVARNPHGGSMGQRRLPDVLLRQPLGGNGLLEGHVEVLFPAHERVVRAPVGKEHTAVVQQKGHGGELGLLLGQKYAAVQAQAALSETRRSRGAAQKLHILF